MRNNVIQKIIFFLQTLGGESFRNFSICNWLQKEELAHFSDYYNIVLGNPNMMPLNVHNFMFRTALSQWSLPLSLFPPSFYIAVGDIGLFK